MSITPAERTVHETSRVEWDPDPSPYRSRRWVGPTDHTARFISSRLTAEVRGDLHQVASTDFEDAVESAFANNPTADIIIGCLPFDPADSAVFVCGAMRPSRARDPRLCSRQPHRRSDLSSTCPALPNTNDESTRLCASSMRARWRRWFWPDPSWLLRRLRSILSSCWNGGRANSPHGFGFHVPLVDGGSFVGLSPELLVERDQLAVSSHPLAGSRSRTGGSDEDAARIADLRASGKDARESIQTGRRGGRERIGPILPGHPSG